MAFADTFAELLGNAGITIGASDLPDKDSIQVGMDRLDAWLSSLEPDTKLAADEVTADFPVKAGLGDPEVDIAPELLPLFTAADNSPINLPVSQLLQVCRDAFDKAVEADV